MKAGDQVIYRRCYREGSKNRGWKWYEYPAEIITRKKKTAVIQYKKHGQIHITHTHISRLSKCEERAAEQPLAPDVADCHELHHEWMKLYNFCPECGADVRHAGKA